MTQSRHHSSSHRERAPSVAEVVVLVHPLGTQVIYISQPPCNETWPVIEFCLMRSKSTTHWLLIPSSLLTSHPCMSNTSRQKPRQSMAVCHCYQQGARFLLAPSTARAFTASETADILPIQPDVGPLLLSNLLDMPAVSWVDCYSYKGKPK